MPVELDAPHAPDGSLEGRARRLEPRVGALEETMMECLRDSAKLIERVRRKPKR
jgi:hypothetical protein